MSPVIKGCAVVVVALLQIVCNCRIDEIVVKGNFNMTRFLGKWYEVSWIPFTYDPWEKRYGDFTHKYVQYENGDVIIDVAARPPNVECLYYKRRLNYTATPGKYLIEQGGGSYQDYWLIDTDYNNYAFTYGCGLINDTTGTCDENHAWIWSRTPQLRTNDNQTIHDVMMSLCLAQNLFETTPQNQECAMTSATNIPITSNDARGTAVTTSFAMTFTLNLFYVISMIA